ncbi:MAG: hypothetical protein ACYS74_05695, partial [Planctomycetota bacterium]
NDTLDAKLAPDTPAEFLYFVHRHHDQTLPEVDTVDSGCPGVPLHETPRDYIGHWSQIQPIAVKMKAILPPGQVRLESRISMRR